MSVGPWDTAISKFDVESSRSRSWVRSKLKILNMSPTFSRLTSLWFHVNRHPIAELRLIQNLTLKIKDQGQVPMVLHNYRSRQFHRTSNVINPSSGFRDMGYAKSGPSAAWFDNFLARVQAYTGQMIITVHNYASRQFDRASNGETLWSGYRDMVYASLAAARPAGTVTTIPLQPKGLRGKMTLRNRNRNTGYAYKLCGINKVFVNAHETQAVVLHLSFYRVVWWCEKRQNIHPGLDIWYDKIRQVWYIVGYN